MRLRSPANALSNVCGLAAGAIGVAALLGWSGQITWLGHAIAQGPAISPTTGAYVLALSVALVIARRLPTGRLIGPARRAAIVLALAGAVVAWLALLGYVTTMPIFFAVPGDPSTGMSVVTALALLILGVGVMGLFPEHGFVALFAAQTEGGTLMRVMLPSAVLFPLVVGGLANHGQAVGWFGREVALAINLGLTSVIIIGLVLWIGLIFKRREAEKRAAEAEREQLLASLRTSLDALSKLQNNLVTVCAWTQRVLDQGKWVRFEEFLDKRLNISITHGISEDAAQDELHSLEDWMNHTSPATQGKASSSSTDTPETPPGV